MREENETKGEEDDSPLSEEELALAREGEKLVEESMAEVRTPRSVRKAIERQRRLAEARDGSRRPRSRRPRPAGSR
jgi:hypothetical protein